MERTYFADGWAVPFLACGEEDLGEEADGQNIETGRTGPPPRQSQARLPDKARECSRRKGVVLPALRTCGNTPRKVGPDSHTGVHRRIRETADNAEPLSGR